MSSRMAHTRRRKIASVQEYATRVGEFANLTGKVSLYPGSGYDRLAAYLSQPFAPQAPDVSHRPPLPQPSRSPSPGSSSFHFVSLYDLAPAAERTPRHVRSPAEFAAHASTIRDSHHGHLLFLRGHPTPQWLLAIGHFYQIDPEFFRSHLEFQPLYLSDYFQGPLPASSVSLRLQINTLAISQAPARSGSHNLPALQQGIVEALKEYREGLKGHAGRDLGESLLRDCTAHDPRHFNLVQDIAVHITATKNSWAAIIWLDNGRDLGEGLPAALLAHLWGASTGQLKFLPVAQYLPAMALRKRSKLVAPSHTDRHGSNQVQQSASLLHLDYGRRLDRDIMGKDPFYAVHELFVFAAHSEVQFLNMLESILAVELDPSALARQKDPSLSNLLYSQQVLDRHILRIEDNLAAIRHRTFTRGLGTNLSAHEALAAEAATRRLETDYLHLLDRAKTLGVGCERGMQVVLNNVMIKESREAIAQAEGVAKLTRLAFVFIPLSFTTSFFGMNFAQFGTGSLDIWIWLLVSAPIVVISLLFMHYGVSQVLGWTWIRNAGRMGQNVP